MMKPPEPIPVLVTPKLDARSPVGDVCGQDGLLPAILDHLQRVACEAATVASVNYQQAWMEGQTGRTGWRAQIQDDTAHLINVLEAEGFATFEEMDNAGH